MPHATHVILFPLYTTTPLTLHQGCVHHPIKYTKSTPAKPNNQHTRGLIFYFRTVDTMYLTDRSRRLYLAA
jgi:hypothetical protein